MSLLARIPILRSIVPPREHRLRYNDEQDRRDVIKSRLLAIATFTTGIGYLVWLFFALNPYHMWMGGAFFAAEVVCLLLFVTATSTVWRLRYKPPEGIPVGHPPSIDIFVTVCGEPLAVVERTLNAVAAIEWPGPRNVFVLDDGGSAEVEATAAASGFVYRSRQRSNVSREGGKAANLNFGLTNSNSELILVLDADQVADPRILHALAGYMRFDGVGFIQSRQFYVVPDGDPFFNLDRVFYEAVQLGYDHRDNAISCGSGVLYRRAALVDIGGFASWNLVEDLTTSYELHSRGWKSFYYPHAVSLGLAPAEIWGVYRQRGQWALDTMRLFFWDNPLLKRGLPWRRRLSYLVIPLTYFGAGFVFPFLFVIPLWTYLTGGSVLADSELEFGLFRGMYFIMMAVALRTLFRRQQTGRQFQMLVGLFPIYLLGTFRALLYPPGRRPRYVPNHASRSSARKPAFLAILPQLTLLAASALLPFYAIAAETAEPRLILSNAFISAAAIWAMLPAILAAVTRKTWNQEDAAYVA
jgi:cellulose synthase (UDP-forming)